MNFAANATPTIHKSEMFEVTRQADGMIAVTCHGDPQDTFDSATSATLIRELATKLERLQTELNTAQADSARFVGQNAALALTARTMSERYENANRLSVGTAELLMRARSTYREQLGALKTELTRTLSEGEPGPGHPLSEAVARLLEPLSA